MLPAKLDYLFVAEFKDGTRYYQDKRDRSLVEPLTRSAFYDVQQRLDEVTKFSLVGGGREHTVFLYDGHFETDGEIIVSHPSLGDLTKRRLIYFRRCEQTVKAGQAMPPKVVGYFIGWQANDEHGRNQQMVLEIPPLGLGRAKPKTKH